MVAYEEILDFITSSPSLEQITAFKLSERAQKRVGYLDLAEAEGKISVDEAAELEEFNRALDFMEKLKVRARRRLDAG